MTPKDDRAAALVEHVDVIDKKHDEAHDRLRTDLRELESRVDSNYTYFRERVELIVTRQERLANALETQGSAPVNLDKLFFSPKVVLSMLGSVIFAVGSISGIFWASTSGMKQDIADVASKLAVRQAKDDSRADIQDVRDKALSNDVADMKRQLQLQQYEIQNLKDLLGKVKKQ